MLRYLTTPLPCQIDLANRYRTKRRTRNPHHDKSKLDISWSKQWMENSKNKLRHATRFEERWQYFYLCMNHNGTWHWLQEVHHFTIDRTEEFKCFLRLHVMSNERGEQTASYRWTGWLWKITDQIPRLQEIYPPFQRNLWNVPRKKKGKPKDDAVSVPGWNLDLETLGSHRFCSKNSPRTLAMTHEELCDTISSLWEKYTNFTTLIGGSMLAFQFQWSGRHNRLRSQCLQVQPVTCWHPPVFLYWIGIYSINPSKTIGNSPAVLNFNRLFLKLNPFICN